jgi:capsule polysaccharide export protein KpsE/RkpR
LSATGKMPIPETHTNERGNYELGSSLPLESVQMSQGFLPYLRLFWEHRQFLLRTAAYALLASILIAFLIPARYQSLTRLMPPDSQSTSGLGMLALMAGRSGAAGSGAAGFGGIAGDLLGVKSSGALFVGILGSETVQDRLIDEFHLMKVYHDWKIEDARKDLAERTEVSEDRKSGIISIGVTDHDPNRAAGMAKAYVGELDRLVAQVSTSSARRERIFLEGRLEKVKADLDLAAKNFSQFASKNSAIDIPAQGKAMVEAAAVLQGHMIAAQSELSGLEQIFTDSNVRVRAAQARVNELQKKLTEIGSAGTQGGSPSENSLFPSIRKLPLLGVTYADLFRQTKIQETVYELLTQQYELAKVQEAKEIPTVKVLVPAIVPTKKTFPPRILIALLGTMLGITLAMMWILGKTQWDLVGESDPRRVFATEVFTTVQARMPKFSRNGASAESNGHRVWSWRKKSDATSEEQGKNLE